MVTVTPNRSRATSEIQVEDEPQVISEPENQVIFNNLSYLAKLNRETVHLQDVDIVDTEGIEEDYQVQFLDPTTKQKTNANEPAQI